MRNIRDFEGPEGPEKPHEREIRIILLILETRISYWDTFFVLRSHVLKMYHNSGVLLPVRIDGRPWTTMVRPHSRNSSDIRAETKKM